jgi:pilus assembly protein Flp/PilA
MSVASRFKRLIAKRWKWEIQNMKTAIKLFTNLLRDESGQDLIEYALVAGLIGLAAVVATTSVGTAISTAFTTIGNKVTNAVP